MTYEIQYTEANGQKKIHLNISMNINQISTKQRNGGIRLIIKSLLEKFVQFFIKLRRPKVTKTQKTTTINLERQKTTSKISQRVLPDVQIKQVEQITDTTTEFSPTIIRVGKEAISDLEPGYVFDTCSLIDLEDYRDKINGYDLKNKLQNKPFYILQQSEEEFADKKCPKNHDELVINRGYTGKPRNFHSNIVELSKSWGNSKPIHIIEISLEIQQLAKKLLPELHNFGLHKGDDIFLAFAKLTKSILITSDNKLILSSVQAQCPKAILFQDFLEKMIQPSPITVVLRERRNYYKHNPRWKKR